DSGRISLPQRARVAYLHQESPEMGGRSVLDETLSALTRLQELDARRAELEKILAQTTEGPAHDAAMNEYGDVLSELEHRDFYTAQSRAESVLFGLGFSESDLHRDVAEFSGGIRMRIALAKLLLDQPEFMMLDEPTNHLDIEARNWLEDYLSSYAGGIIVVSHDRYFLDRITKKTVEVARGKLTEYVGGYSRYLEQREERFQLEMQAYQKQREEIDHMEAFISRFRYQASKAKLVQSRIKQLEKVERLEPPVGSEKPPAIHFPQCERSARRVFEVKGAVKKYGDLVVYDGVDLVIERGARIALVGPNGAGKSTMMKLLAGIEPMTAGERIVGGNVALGYFAQNLADTLDYTKTVYRELSDATDAMSDREMRSLLGATLFSGDDVEKKVAVLSGGERARLALSKVIAHRNNTLLLDEPTNNLDIVAKDTLLEALKGFPGTILLVSHDRFILNELASEVIEVGRGHAIRYLGNYDDYLRKKAEMELANMAQASRVNASKPAAKAPMLASTNGIPAVASLNGATKPDKAVEQAKRVEDRDAKRKRDQMAKRRQQIEGSIESKEAERASLAVEMNDPNFYLQRKDADQLIARYQQLEREVERLYAELEKIEAEAPVTPVH
ncbi:MAG TPA: ABC-F family ATP-binding cassette domain-containing protein, partial [Candidatus Binataceae bacterium]|nr:ABC-F family ATP-binding cassette domain-containing protein [Candidatus Binataceae bacterium]